MKDRIISVPLLVVILLTTSLSVNASEERCSASYAWSAADGRCIPCNRPCKTDYLGQCRHGIVDCSQTPPQCRSAVLPGERAERCDGSDNDCDGQVDEGFDRDGDGYTTCGGDCNDQRADVFPDSPEKCDGIDNDCDGQIDEPFNIGRTCHVGKGSCRRRGVLRCAADLVSARCDATPAKPQPEVCDGHDNDCDGLIDEELGEVSCGTGVCRVTVAACRNGNRVACIPRKPQEEICGDGLDNDCDGAIDEGFERLDTPCELGIGACKRAGQFVCGEKRKTLVCNAVAAAPQKEICGNKIDDDCNGVVDDVKGLGTPCDNGQRGICHRKGSFVCDRTTGGITCSAQRIAPQVECCDGADNDCDGKTDEDLGQTRECGYGVCQGGQQSRTCVAGMWTPWTECSTASNAVSEICDGLDNDCDGSVDDGVVEKRRCGAGECAGGSQERRCELGAWGAWSSCTTDSLSSVEMCDGKDNDCDGQIDEGVTNACGGCGELAGRLGERCRVVDKDECGVGVYVCNKAIPGEVVCEPRFDQSEGRKCTADDNICTLDECRNGSCMHIPVDDGMPCNDDNACTIADLCLDGACVGGARGICNDDNPCTLDNCDPQKGCIYTAVDDGQRNECGGCNVLTARPGESCRIEGKRGPCMHGVYSCLPEGGVACIQNVFSLEETCNGIDDDCNGMVDDGLGYIECGEGVCRVAVDRCRNGHLDVCIPLDPGIEDCTNRGTDDDCNGIIDDVPALGTRCAMVVGSCVVPGSRQCMNAKTPVCVSLDPRFVKDDDGDGLVNYCDERDTIMEVATHLPARGKHLLDVNRTRAFMLPWKNVSYATVLKKDSHENGALVIEGSDGMRTGFAELTKKVVEQDSIYLTPCWLADRAGQGLVVPVGRRVVVPHNERLVVVDDIVARLDENHSNDCVLQVKRVASLITHDDRECADYRIAALVALGDSHDRVAWATLCRTDEMNRRNRETLSIGIVRLEEKEASAQVTEIDRLVARHAVAHPVIIPFVAASPVFVMFVTIDGNQVVVRCRHDSGRWSCTPHPIDIDVPIVFATAAFPRGDEKRIFMIDKQGGAYWMVINARGIPAISSAGGVPRNDPNGFVYEGMVMPEEGRRVPLIVLARENMLTLLEPVTKKDTIVQFVPRQGEYYRPLSMRDGISPGDKTIITRPHALAAARLSQAGGMGLFAAYTIASEGVPIGTMGFYYYPVNEVPRGGIRDIMFDGRRGKANLAFVDPADDDLTIDTHFVAFHGGSLDEWIDEVWEGVLTFSVKGDSTAVGLWPITIRAVARDPGGKGVESTVILARDGSVQSIREMVVEQ